MKFVSRTVSGITIDQVDRWIEADVVHGFLCRDADLGEKRERFSEKLSEIAPRKARLFLLRQRHTNHIVDVRPDSKDSLKNLPREDADGWLVDRKAPGFDAHVKEHETLPAFGILTADCVPVLLRAPKRDLSSALHCGWRGTAFGILPRALEQMKLAGADPEEIEVAIGPGAGPCCYEVGDDVISGFIGVERSIRGGRPLSIIPREGKAFADIRTLLGLQAEAFGVLPSNIAVSPACTICDTRFFSYRREKEHAGRQLSFIG